MSLSASDPLIGELRAHAGWARALARALVSDHDLADDLVQEAWTAAVRHRPEVDRPLRPWLGTVMRNLARAWHRSAPRVRAREALSEAQRAPSSSPEDDLALLQQVQQLASLVEALGPAYRETLMLRFFDDLSSAEIARRIGVPEGTVRWRLKAGLDQLRARLEEEHRGPGDWRRALAPLAAFPLAKAGRLSVGAVGALAVAALVVGSVPLWRARPPSAARPGSVARAAGGREAPNPGAPRAPASITGRVVDAAGRPVPRATVLVAADGAGGPVDLDGEILPVRAGADGGFRFAGLSPGRWTVSATSPAHLGATQVVPLASDGRAEIELVLEGEGVTISGQVLDVGGGPIPGAQVRADADRGPAFAALADEAGRYALRLRPGPYSLGASAEGYASGDARRMQVLADETHDLELFPASAVAGWVKEIANDRPVGGAIVVARPDKPGRTARGRSKEDGSFHLAGLRPGGYRLFAQAGGLAGVPVAVAVPLAYQVAGIELSIGRAYAVAGVALDRAGRPIAGARIALEEAEGVGFGFRHMPERAVSDAEGRFRIEGLRPGRFHLSAHAPPLADADVVTVAVVDADVEDVRLTLPPGGPVVGRVVSPEGRPLGEVQVSVTVRAGKTSDSARRGGGLVRTGRDGRFRVDALGTGWLVIKATDLTGRSVTYGPRLFDPAERSTEITIEFETPVFVAGRVTWRDGAPAGGVRVRWLGAGQSVSEGVVVIADGQGRFRMGPLEPGPGLLRAERLDADVRIGSSRTLSNEVRLDLSDGRDRPDVALSLARANQELGGVVVDGDGAPVRDAVIEVEPTGAEGESAWTRASAVSDAEGRFTLRRLTAGAHVVRASAPGYATSDRRQVSAGARDLRLVLPRYGSVSGRVVDAGGRPAPLAHVRLLPAGRDRLPFSAGMEMGASATAAASGATFSFGVVKPGVYEVLATTSAGAAARIGDLEVKPGGSRDGLRLVLGPAMTVRGTVVEHETGLPLAGVGLNLPWTNAHVHARTDEEGRFEISGLAPGQVFPLMVRGDQTLISEVWMVSLPANGSAEELPPFHLIRRPSAPPPGFAFSGPNGLELDVRSPGGALVLSSAAELQTSGGPRPGDRLTTVAGRDVRGLGPLGLQVVLGLVPPGPVELRFLGPGGPRMTTVTLTH